MKLLMKALGAASLAALAACGGADDRAQENIEAVAENRADALEARADNATNEVVEDRLEDKAEAVRDAGEDLGERADDRLENRVR